MLYVPKITRKLLTNTAFGYPRGATRGVQPIAVLCVHVTSNGTVPPASATQERDYANRAGSGGPSAHFYADRTGALVQAVDWIQFAAWSNGDVKSPKLSKPGVQALVNFTAAGHNMNEAFAIEVENCGKDPDFPITYEQVKANAFLAALASIEFDLPITRATVHPHSDVNSETRASCPAPAATVEALLSSIITLANDYREVLLLRDQIERLSLLVSANAAEIDGLKERVAALSDNLSIVSNGLIDARNKLHEWEDYSVAVKSDAGSILGRDVPA